MQLEVGTPPINWWFSARFDCQRVNTHNFLVSFGAGHLFIQNLILQYLLHFITILGRLIIYYHIYYIPFLYNKNCHEWYIINVVSYYTIICYKRFQGTYINATGLLTHRRPCLCTSIDIWRGQGHHGVSDGEQSLRNGCFHGFSWDFNIYNISGWIIRTSLFSLTGIMDNRGNHPKMALFQVCELL